MNLQELQAYIERVRQDEGLAWILSQTDKQTNLGNSCELHCFDNTGTRILLIEEIAADQSGKIPAPVLRQIERSREFCGIISDKKLG